MKRRQKSTPQIKKMAAHYRGVLKLAGFDPTKGDLADTPQRAARAFLEMTSGHRTSIDDQMSTFKRECRKADDECGNMITLQGIRFVSLCEHHLLPFVGEATIGYIPGKKIIGLSKLTRIVEYFAHRPQNQERMAHDIAEFIEELLEPTGIAVVIDGKHTCASGRGVEDHNSVFKMDVLQGVFLTNPPTRAEFFARIAHPTP